MDATFTSDVSWQIQFSTLSNNKYDDSNQPYTTYVQNEMNRSVALRHLRAFSELADTGSFTSASARLCVTQSSLTATIQQLESVVGVKLFDRTTRSVVMTEEAVRFKVKADQILRDFDTAISDLQAYAQGHVGHISIAAAASFLYHFMVSAIAEFRSSYPSITLTLRDAGAGHVEQLVIDGDVDFAIADRPKNNDVLEYVPLLTDRYGVVCRNDFHLAQCPKPLRWDRLPSEGFIALTPDTGISSFLHDQVSHLAVFKGRHDEASSTTSLFALISQGNCFSILPALAANLAGFAQFSFRPLEEPILHREVGLITRRLRSLTPGATRLVETLISAIDRQELPLGVESVFRKRKS